jgi:phosphatidylserine/phosphatidylglycerophosphate/cardiolipin synthase-like enzyme
MDHAADLDVTLLLNIQRWHGDTTATDELVIRFAERLWRHDWPGDRRPAVFYDPRSLEPTGSEGVLHAKAVVVDEEVAFVTSANLTEAAFDRSIDVGVLPRDRALAASLARHFRVLIEQERVLPLP